MFIQISGFLKCRECFPKEKVNFQTHWWSEADDWADPARGPSHPAQHPAQQAEAAPRHVHQPRRPGEHGHRAGRPGREHAQGHGPRDRFAQAPRPEQQAEHQRPQAAHGRRHQHPPTPGHQQPHQRQVDQRRTPARRPR